MQNSRAKILIVDDEAGNVSALRKILKQEAFSVISASNGQEALDVFRKEGADIVISDLRMPGMDGFELLRTIRLMDPSVPVVIVSAFGTIDTAVGAMKLGAIDFISKPLSRKSVLKAVQDCMSRLKRNVNYAGKQLIIGQSKEMAELRRTIHVVAPTCASILIEGESGTGKGVVARAVHQESGVSGDMVSINCAAIPETLLESELFGFDKGAFTGATSAKRGLVETAHNGTLFLDEIGELPLKLQSKLLRFLEDGSFLRLGSVEPRKANVRIIAASNSNIVERVVADEFREDLWYRLNVIHLMLCPLRERGADSLLLANFFLESSTKKYARKNLRFSKEAEEAICTYPWPGNVRELQNAIERAVVLTPGEEITRSSLKISYVNLGALNPVKDYQSSDGDINISIGTSLKDVEAELISRTLKATKGDKSLAAKILGVNVRTIYRKLQD